MTSPREMASIALEAARLGEPAACRAWLDARAREGLSGLDAEGRGVAARVLGALARDAALSLDAERVAALDDQITKLAADDARAAGARALTSAWRALLSDDARALDLTTRALTAMTELRDAEGVVEATALHALARLAEDDVAEGLRIARRASRMARTEAIPVCEVLAHLVLARARRASGHPHLALRITRGLAGFSASGSSAGAHRGWLALERSLAGGAAGDEPTPVGATSSVSVGAVVRPLAAWVAAAEQGHVEAFDDATRTLGTATRGLPSFVRRELDAIVLAVDARLDPTRSRIEPFLRGATADVPPVLAGLGTTRGAEEAAIAYVASRQRGPARRVVRLGRALAAHGRVALKQTRMKQGRTETVVAALLLAGPSGLAEDVCFRAVYGFAYVPELHRGAFDVTLHRAREWIGEHGAIERRGSVVSLEARRALLCPDPRSSGSLSDAVLVALADHGARGAKEIAEATGIPLRAVQTALAELARDGACDARPGSGRAMEYVVEDTTFTEPTAAG